jgi:hypothetical protein
MFIVEMKRTMKYKRKTLRRRSRARKQRGGAIGDIAKYFSFLMAPHPDGEIADFTMPEELVERIPHEPRLNDRARDLLSKVQISCLHDKLDKYGLTKEYIDSYNIDTGHSPLHAIGHIASIDDLQICSKMYFDELKYVIFPKYVLLHHTELNGVLLEFRKIHVILNKPVSEETGIDYNDIKKNIKRMLIDIPYNSIKSIFTTIITNSRILKEKMTKYSDVYGIVIPLHEYRSAEMIIGTSHSTDTISSRGLSDIGRDVISLVLLENMNLLIPILEKLIGDKEGIKHRLDSICNDIYATSDVLQPLIISFLRMKIVEEKYGSMHIGEDSRITQRGWDPSRKERRRTNEEYRKKYNITSESMSKLVSVLEYYIYNIISGPVDARVTAITSVS